MTIRVYDQNDFRKIISIYNSSKLDELKYELTTFELLPLEQDAQRYSNLMESKIYVCEVHKQVVAYGAYLNNEIRALFVHPGARRKGVGKTLFKFLLSQISGPVTLCVARTNKPAIKLYKSFNFSVSSDFMATYNGTPVKALKMSQ